MSRQTAELGVAGQQKSITVFELKNIKCSEKVVQAVWKKGLTKEEAVGEWISLHVLILKSNQK